MQRGEFSHMKLIRELSENNPDDFKNYMRMSDSAFTILLEKVEHQLIKLYSAPLFITLAPENSLTPGMCTQDF